MQGEGGQLRRGWCKERGQCKKKGMVPGEGDDVTEAALCSGCFQSGISQRVSKSPNCANVFTCLPRAQAAPAGLTR